MCASSLCSALFLQCVPLFGILFTALFIIAVWYRVSLCGERNRVCVQFCQFCQRNHVKHAFICQSAIAASLRKYRARGEMSKHIGAQICAKFVLRSGCSEKFSIHLLMCVFRTVKCWQHDTGLVTRFRCTESGYYTLCNLLKTREPPKAFVLGELLMTHQIVANPHC